MAVFSVPEWSSLLGVLCSFVVADLVDDDDGASLPLLPAGNRSVLWSCSLRSGALDRRGDLHGSRRSVGVITAR